MKKISYLFLFCEASVLFACSEYDDDKASTTTFEIPLTTRHFWTYTIENEEEISTDSLFISNDTIIASKTFKKFKTKNDFAIGFFSSAVRDNGVR